MSRWRLSRSPSLALGTYGPPFFRRTLRLSAEDLLQLRRRLAGAGLTGLGYALVYPGLGVEAVKRAPPESRGLAMGAYTAFLDVALGFGTPLLGLAAEVCPGQRVRQPRLFRVVANRHPPRRPPAPARALAADQRVRASRHQRRAGGA